MNNPAVGFRGRLSESSQVFILFFLNHPHFLALSKSKQRTTYKSKETIVKERNGCHALFPTDFPNQVFETADDVYVAVNKRAGEYGFSIIKSGLRAATRSSGRKARISCSCWGLARVQKSNGSREITASRKTGCPWSVWCEEIEETTTGEETKLGWMVSMPVKSLEGASELVVERQYIQNFHNHPLNETWAQKMADSGFRTIPECLLVQADFLAEVGNKPTKIYCVLLNQCDTTSERPIAR